MSRVHQNCPSCTCQEVELTEAEVFAVVQPTPEQLAQAHISAQMLEDDRHLTIQTGGGR
jgi:hypothetical protein